MRRTTAFTSLRRHGLTSRPPAIVRLLAMSLPIVQRPVGLMVQRRGHSGLFDKDDPELLGSTVARFNEVQPTRDDEKQPDEKLPKELRGGKLMVHVHAVFDVTEGRMRTSTNAESRTRAAEEAEHDRQFVSMLEGMGVRDAGQYVAKGRAAFAAGGAIAALPKEAAPEPADEPQRAISADTGSPEVAVDADVSWTVREVMEDFLQKHAKELHYGAVVSSSDLMRTHILVWKAGADESIPFQVVTVIGFPWQSLTTQRYTPLQHHGTEPPTFEQLLKLGPDGNIITEPAPNTTEQPQKVKLHDALRQTIFPMDISFKPLLFGMDAKEPYIHEADGGPQLWYNRMQAEHVRTYQESARARLPIFVVCGESGSGKTIGACFTLAQHFEARGRVVHGNLYATSELRKYLEAVDMAHADLLAAQPAFAKYLVDALDTGRYSSESIRAAVQELVHVRAKHTPAYRRRTELAVAMFKTWLASTAHPSFMQWHRQGKPYEEQALLVIDEAGVSPGFARGLVAGSAQVYKHLQELQVPRATVVLCGTGLDYFRHEADHAPCAGKVTSNPDNTVVVVVRQEKGKLFAAALWGKLSDSRRPLDTVPLQGLLEPLWDNARLCSFIVRRLHGLLMYGPLSRGGEEAVVSSTVEGAFRALLTRNGLSKLEREPGKRLAVINAAYWALEDTIADAPRRVSELLPDELLPAGPHTARESPASRSADTKDRPVDMARGGGGAGARSRDRSAEKRANTARLAQHAARGNLLPLSQAWAAVVQERGGDTLVTLGEFPNERLGLLGEPVYYANDTLSGRKEHQSRPAEQLEELLTTAVQGGLLVQPHPHVYSASSAIRAAIAANFEAPTVYPGDGQGFEELIGQRLKRHAEAQGYTTRIVRLGLPYPRPPGAHEPSAMAEEEVVSIVSHLNPSVPRPERNVALDLNTIGANRHRRAVVILNGPNAPAADVMLIARDAAEGTLHIELWDVKHKDDTKRAAREITLGLPPMDATDAEGPHHRAKIEGAQYLRAVLVHLGTAVTIDDCPPKLNDAELTEQQQLRFGEGAGGKVFVRRAGSEGAWRLSIRFGLANSVEASKNVEWAASAAASERTVTWRSSGGGSKTVSGVGSLLMQYRPQLGLQYDSVLKNSADLPVFFAVPASTRSHGKSARKQPDDEQQLVKKPIGKKQLVKKEPDEKQLGEKQPGEKHLSKKRPDEKKAKEEQHSEKQLGEKQLGKKQLGKKQLGKKQLGKKQLATTEVIPQ